MRIHQLETPSAWLSAANFMQHFTIKASLYQREVLRPDSAQPTSHDALIIQQKNESLPTFLNAEPAASNTVITQPKCVFTDLNAFGSSPTWLSFSDLQHTLIHTCHNQTESLPTLRLFSNLTQLLWLASNLSSFQQPFLNWQRDHIASLPPRESNTSPQNPCFLTRFSSFNSFSLSPISWPNACFLLWVSSCLCRVCALAA